MGLYWIVGRKKEKFSKKDVKFNLVKFLCPPTQSRVGTGLALSLNVSKRAEAYEKVGNRFTFLSSLSTMSTTDLDNKCKHLADVYHQDIDYNEMFNECLHLKHMQNGINATVPTLYRQIVTENLKSIFPNIEIVSRIYLCMMVTNCTGERSFSRLKLIKSNLRSTIGQTRLNSLSLLCIENELLKTVDFTSIIDDFCKKKCRKRVF